MSALHAGLAELARVHLDRVEAARLELVEQQLRDCAALDQMLLGPLRQQLVGGHPASLHEPMHELAEQLTWRLHRAQLERLGRELERSRRLAITWQVCSGTEGFLDELDALGRSLHEEASGGPNRASTRLMARLGLLEACDQLLDPQDQALARFEAALRAADRRRALERHSLERFGALARLLDREGP